MKKFISNCIKVLIMLFAICMIISKPTQADVGYFSSYDSGGSSSSGSSWSSSSSHDYDWSSSSSHRSSSSSSSSSDDGAMGLVSVLVFIIVVIVIIYLNKKGVINNREPLYNNIPTTDVDNTNSVEEQIRQIDPMFSAENFMAFAKEVFVKLQTAWMERKWEDIRPFESNELFEQHSKQLQYLIDANQINMMEKICVRHTHLNSFRQDGDKEVITMTLKSAARDYTIDADTKKVVQGDPNKDVYMIYTLTFMRKSGVKTKEGTDKKSTTNCPNCGAPTKITSSGKCEYCGSIITTGEHDWVLSNLEGRHGM